MDLSIKYRPTVFSGIIGQNTAVRTIKETLRRNGPSGGTFLFYGSSGVGKTTAARILAQAVNCENAEYGDDPCGECDSCKMILAGRSEDIIEVNTSKDRGIDLVRDILSQFKYLPMQSKHKVCILDESHGLTTSAQNALLEFLEDPRGVYVVLCSTEPRKIIKTVKSRSIQVRFSSVGNIETFKLLKDIVEAEGLEAGDKGIPTNILHGIAKASDGSVRESLKKLQTAVSLTKAGKLTPDEVADILSYGGDLTPAVVKLCRMIKDSSNFLWRDLMEVYKKSDIKEPLTLSAIICGYFRKLLESGKDFTTCDFAAKTMEVFLEPYPIMKPENKLVLNLYKAYTLNKGKKKRSFKR